MASASPTSGTTTALSYTRVSTDEQRREGLSLDAQLAECRRYAAAFGWELGPEYEDVMSGRRADRPGYQRLLADCRRMRAEGRAVAVVIAAVDRFSRRLVEAVSRMEELQSLGVAIHAVRQGGQVSQVMAHFTALLAQEETRQLGERVRASYARLRERGWWAPGCPPWGYRIRPATDAERAEGAPLSVLEAHPDEAPAVRRAFAMAAEGASVRRVALYAAGLPEAERGSHKGRPRALRYSCVAGLLRAEVYRPDPAHRWPALVDAATWAAAQRHMDSQRDAPHQASGAYLLTGRIWCPACGGRMTGAVERGPRGQVYRRYACHRSNDGAPPVRCRWSCPADPLERQVLKALAPAMRTLGDEAALRRAIDRAVARRSRGGEGDPAARRRALIAEQARAKGRLAEAALALVDGRLDREAYDALRERVGADMAACRAALVALDAAPDGRAPLDPETILAKMRACRADHRAVVRLLVERVDVRRRGDGPYTYEAVVRRAPWLRWLAEPEAARAS